MVDYGMIQLRSLAADVIGKAIQDRDTLLYYSEISAEYTPPSHALVEAKTRYLLREFFHGRNRWAFELYCAAVGYDPDWVIKKMLDRDNYIERVKVGKIGKAHREEWLRFLTEEK